MDRIVRHFLVSLSTLIAAGALTIALLTSGIDAMQHKQHFEELQEDATALNIAAQNLIQLTRECGYTDTTPAEKILKETAALAEFDIHFQWTSRDTFRLTVSQGPDQQEGRVASESLFTYTDDIKISSGQNRTNPQERTPDEVAILASMCGNLK